MQFEFEFPVEKKLTISDIESGEPFKITTEKSRGKQNDVFIKVSPTSRCFNSRFISDVTARGDCFIVNLLTGSFYPISGSIEVEIQNIVMKTPSGAAKK